ncbi:hypothetical protein HWQ17_16990 [Enterobacter pasteurii]|uniref:hypothetical protein n=1 Tax=Enterobacter pasteurii TaxID=3029761 RepID=UPI0011DCC0B5|nr:hypothetical protein [Enterobacter pasteurii]QLA69210.1 hypothetical protein HWQ17_16990 [Enterobacter pasteurii]
MKIACLGWGSLIWKSGALPIAGEWHTDGPSLPVEFCRVSDGGELATAICMNAPAVPVLWVWLDVTTLSVASEALREREGIPDDRCDGIGSLLITERSAGELSSWARERGIEALIWTGLPPRSAAQEGRIPAVEEAIAYLDSLSGQTRSHAKDYMRRVPAQLDTPYRRVIKEVMGW